MSGGAVIWQINQGGGGGGSIAIDTSSSQVFTGNDSFSWSHTVSGANRYLIVDVVGSEDSVVGVTFNGSDMSLIASELSSDGYQLTKWGLIAPASGAHSVVVTVSGPPAVYAAIASSWTGVHQTTPIGTPVTNSISSSASEITVDASSASGEVVVDGAFVYNRTLVADAGQTQVQNIVNTDDNVNLATSYKAGASTTTMIWDWAPSQAREVIVAVPFKPA